MPRFGIGAAEIIATICPQVSPIPINFVAQNRHIKECSQYNLIAFVLCDSQGFEGSRHTLHLGRTEPGECIVQVTEEAVNIVQQSGFGVFELAASWRPPPLPSPSSSCFKVQHAGTAGTIVAAVCESTMFLIDVREVAADQATRGRTDGEDPAPSAAVQAKQVLRMELDGGPVSALGMRLLGGNGDARERADCE